MYTLLKHGPYHLSRIKAPTTNTLSNVLATPNIGLNVIATRRRQQRTLTIRFDETDMLHVLRRTSILNNQRQLISITRLIAGNTKGRTCSDVNGSRDKGLTTHRRMVTSQRTLINVHVNALISALMATTRGRRTLTFRRTLNRVLYGKLTAKNGGRRNKLEALKTGDLSNLNGELSLRRRTLPTTMQLIVSNAVTIIHPITRIVHLGVGGTNLTNTTRGQYKRSKLGRLKGSQGNLGRRIILPAYPCQSNHPWHKQGLFLYQRSQTRPTQSQRSMPHHASRPQRPGRH